MYVFILPRPKASWIQIRYSSRVVVNASALPDPREVNYDQLLA